MRKEIVKIQQAAQGEAEARVAYAKKEQEREVQSLTKELENRSKRIITLRENHQVNDRPSAT